MLCSRLCRWLADGLRVAASDPVDVLWRVLLGGVQVPPARLAARRRSATRCAPGVIPCSTSRPVVMSLQSHPPVSSTHGTHRQQLDLPGTAAVRAAPPDLVDQAAPVGGQRADPAAALRRQLQVQQAVQVLRGVAALPRVLNRALPASRAGMRSDTSPHLKTGLNARVCGRKQACAAAGAIWRTCSIAAELTSGRACGCC
jgi:hypothetical protein